MHLPRGSTPASQPVSRAAPRRSRCSRARSESPRARASCSICSSCHVRRGPTSLRLLRRTAIGGMLVPYLLILAVWPFPGDRFIWSILAWLALIWAAGALALVRRWRLLRLPLAVLVGVMLVGWGGVQVRGFAHRWWGTAGSRVSENFRELLPALESLPRDAVLATDDEALIWLYARRTSVPFYVYTYRGRTSVRPTPAEHRAYLERQRVTHILMGGFGSGSDEELDALLGAYPRWLKVVRVWRGGRALFEVQHAS